jgi:Ca2+:H+ antiporter
VPRHLVDSAPGSQITSAATRIKKAGGLGRLLAVDTDRSQALAREHSAKSENAAAELASVFVGLWKEPLYYLLLGMPLALALRWWGGSPVWTFFASAVTIIPLAGLMGRSTENLAETMGPGIGGLLNATFGNAAELIIALIALSRGAEMYPLVKASLTGSIIGNILLVLGLSILMGGLRHSRQQFNRTAAGMGATILALASIGLVMPTVYYLLYQSERGLTELEQHNVELLSEEIAGILAITYGLSLVFTLVTHRHLFSTGEIEASTTRKNHTPEWSRNASLIVLVLATAGIGVMSELLVGTVEHAAHALGMTQVFVGVIVIAVIGNAAEHSTAVLTALKNKMDLSVHIAVGSSIQIALFVAPVLVFASMIMGHDHPLDLHFTTMELIAVVVAVGVFALVAQDGECHWMEGVMLLAVYLIIALTFFHLPSDKG